MPDYRSKKNIINLIYILSSVFLLFFSLSIQSYSQDYDETVMNYYLQNIDSVLDRAHLYDEENFYSVDIKTIFDNINYRGELDESDTAEYKAYYGAGKIDSSKVIDSAKIEENIAPDDIGFIKPWKQNCYFYFFPNDTGGSELAIGFEPNNPDSEGVAAGMMIIDRYSYKLKKIYLHYREIGKYDRLSQAYEYAETDSGLVLSHLVIQGSFLRFFSRSFFKQDVHFSNYQFEGS
jgi:hypothetical protein